MQSEIAAICQARHGDPFSILGPHHGPHARTCVRAFLPTATSVAVVDGHGKELASLDKLAPGFFAGEVPIAITDPYRLRVRWSGQVYDIIEDPYRFPMVLSDMDVWLLAEGTHLRPFEVMGAHPRTLLDVTGTTFAVWAPNALRVSVVGDFNHWDGRRHPMRLRQECGIWELFLPGVHPGAVYKYEILAHDGHAGSSILPLRSDPYALQCELRPATASVVRALPPPVRVPPQRKQANALDAPISIYEVHLGSWKRVVEDGNRCMDWDEIAQSLIAYVQDMGFTHIELLPVSEHPYDGSWGYQPLGLYAPTARFGDPDGLARLVQRCHAQGIGVLLDWVPAHFPGDAHGLAYFDGTHLYEYADPREGFHNDWKTYIYNLGRTEVRNHLLGNALYWLERFGVDGLRVDAVASMLYRDYSRKPGEWIPNVYGGRENLESISFLRRMNEIVCAECPHAMTVAEESTAYPGVSRPTYTGGLGFHYKWNMGWMHDTLSYMARDPVHRKYHQEELTFGLVYAFHENFVLPISHDEVVHGKGSLLRKMPGDRWQQFANLRVFLGYMYAHPGKKLLFMGCEFGQDREWNYEHSLDWHLLDDPAHAGIQQLVRELNALYRNTPALYQQDFVPDGFHWIDHGDAEHSVLAFARRGVGDRSLVVVVCNFTPVVWTGYRLGVPRPGGYAERLDTDAERFGGSGVHAFADGLGTVEATAEPWQNQPHSVVLTLPPLAAVFLEWMG
ncbi:1,4-alpha-glucan branching protein GlgB [Candidatus Symbiobacter mobilis]|uniref:1,4-alpha-glucan branching enzyme GlgB n=1 Tax=Candidatus Symbiobacter mobilis CR TaxID=946483 RepID=U5NBI7_9BURK|nr:1,4-alpha-glucan branching protein GlgB [Candidatus Symbiobacter mobilis]AGX87539.1 1,4-alpha-glucan branching enzyme [Candidatus Symbiobacter mobilis CR]